MSADSLEKMRLLEQLMQNASTMTTEEKLKVFEQLTNRSISLKSLEAAMVANVGAWFHDMPAVYIVFIAVCIALFLATLFSSIILFVRIQRFVANEVNRGDLCLVASMPLVVSSCCIAGNILLKASTLLSAIALTYLLVIFHITINMVIGVFGSSDAVADWLINENQKISLDARPFCCCCICLPKLEPTRNRVKLLTFGAKHSPLFRIFLMVVILVMASSQMAKVQLVTTILSALMIISAITAVFASHIIIQNTSTVLDPYGLGLLFKCVNFSQVFYSVLKFILDILARYNAIEAMGKVPASYIASYWHNVVLIFWMFFASILMNILLTPKRSCFFVGRPQQKELSEPDSP